jgi:hypothetical protein
VPGAAQDLKEKLVGTGRFELPTPRTPSEKKPDRGHEHGINAIRDVSSELKF